MHLRRFFFLPLTCVALSPLGAASFTWNNVTGNWSVGTSWAGGSAPSGTVAGDVLIFGGDVGTIAGTAPNYTATNDIAAVPFQLSQITLQATDANGAATDPPHIIAGNALRFSLAGAQIVQNGAGPISFNLPIQLNTNLAWSGDGTGSVTLNYRLSGFGDITKSGSGTFRFGTPQTSPATPVPSDNTWFGALRLNSGTVRFNNNAESGRTAVRANPVIFPASAATPPSLTSSSELRTGALSGTVGTVESLVTGTNIANEDIVVTALADGTFGGTVHLGPPTGTGNDAGTLVIRGPAVQTFTGTMQIEKDVAVGGTLVLAGTASLGTQTKGAVHLAGGTFRLDNTTTNDTNRLRDAGTASTSLDVAGGGTFAFIGNTAGSSETIGRLQLASQTGTTSPFKTKQRSGHLNLSVTHRAGAAAATVLTIATYERDTSTRQPLDTVEFSAVDGSGTTLALGSSGSNPRIVFSTAPTVVNGLFSNNSGDPSPVPSTGWAVVKTTTGLAFAAHGVNGVFNVATVTPPAGNTAGSATNNANLTTQAVAITAATYSLNSLRIQPSGGTLSVGSTSTLATTGIALAGSTDFSITGTGALGGGAPRYIHVEQANLTLTTALGNAQPLVKAGAGTLILTNAGNSANQQILAMNNGLVRATPGSTLPGGELRFRGGVLEVLGGGTFARPMVDTTSLLSGPGTVNWSTTELLGVPAAPSDAANDRGSGGFASIGGDLLVDLSTALVAGTLTSDIRWEQKGFVKSGHALVFGSKNASGKVTLINNLNLTSAEASVNYNAREIRVLDNPSSSADRAVLSGVVSGTVHNDLLKTGPGVLELSNAANTFAGLAIVQAGTLVVSGSAGGIGIDVMNGATLAGGGTVTSILLETGATLSPGDSTTATLTGTGLMWKAGATCRFDLGAANASDRLALGAGTLRRSGAGTFAFDFGNTGQTNQSYTVATFGSTDFVASDFTAINLAGSVTGHFVVSANSLIFSTIPPAPIDTWRETYFGAGATNSGNAADGADPDLDGLTNLLEYLLGTNPTQASSGARPLIGGTAAAVTFTFNRNLNATDVNVRVESADALSAATSWTPIATRNAGGTWSGSTGVTVTETAAGAVTVTDTPGGSARRFYHLLVEHP